MESMDQDNLPSAKRDLLRQMSSPNGPKDDSRANLNRKVQANMQRQLFITSFFFSNAALKKKTVRFHQV